MMSSGHMSSCDLTAPDWGPQHFLMGWGGAHTAPHLHPLPPQRNYWQVRMASGGDANVNTNTLTLLTPTNSCARNSSRTTQRVTQKITKIGGCLVELEESQEKERGERCVCV